MRRRHLTSTILIGGSVLVAGTLSITARAAAAEPAPAPRAQRQAPADTSNALRSALQGTMERYRGFLVRSAELMPEEHYGFRPVDEVRTFGEELAHVASSSVGVCAALGGSAAPEPPDLSGLHDGSKEEIVSGLERSFDYCGEAIAAFEDAARGDAVTLFGGYETTKAAGALILAADWADHYGHVATYMRMNGILPASARGDSE